jgi:hypothetical protein
MSTKDRSERTTVEVVRLGGGLFLQPTLPIALKTSNDFKRKGGSVYGCITAWFLDQETPIRVGLAPSSDT